MQTTKPALVATSAAAVEAIHTFNQELFRSPGLAERLAYARAWYAVQESPDGNWLFGPSKFIGYAGLTADLYLETAGLFDGRRTETQLQRWFRELDPASPQFADLAPRLSAFLARYAKAPSRKARINVLRGSERRSHSSVQSAIPLVDLLAAVAEMLSPSELDLLVRRLNALRRALR